VTLEVVTTIDVCGMVDQASHPNEEAPSTMERFQEEVLVAFAMVDSIQEECK